MPTYISHGIGFWENEAQAHNPNGGKWRLGDVGRLVGQPWSGLRVLRLRGDRLSSAAGVAHAAAFVGIHIEFP